MRTFKADIRLLIFVSIFRTSWPKMGVLGQNGGRGGAMLTPKNSFLLLGVLMSVPNLVKSIKKCDRVSAHRRIHTVTDANRFYNLPHAICYNQKYMLIFMSIFPRAFFLRCEFRKLQPRLVMISEAFWHHCSFNTVVVFET